MHPDIIEGQAAAALEVQFHLGWDAGQIRCRFLRLLRSLLYHLLFHNNTPLLHKEVVQHISAFLNLLLKLISTESLLPELPSVCGHQVWKTNSACVSALYLI